MFGNTQGWLISAVIAGLMGFLLYTLVVPPNPTPPTGSAVLGVAKKPIELPVPATTVVPAGTDDCDAGTLYRQAIDDYKISSTPYDRFEKNAMSVPIAQLPAMTYILKAANCKNFSLFKNKPAELVNYDNEEPPLHALDKIGTDMCTMGLVMVKRADNKDPKGARALWEAAFQLGARLYQERVSWSELQVGHGIMQTAAQNLRQQATDENDAARADAIDKFMASEGEYAIKLTEAFKLIGAIDEKYAGRYAGDVRAIALSSSADPMFRVESLKHLGHYKFNAENKGDQLGAKKVLNQLAADASLPPTVKLAATMAHDLTSEKHQMVGASVE